MDYTGFEFGIQDHDPLWGPYIMLISAYKVVSRA